MSWTRRWAICDIMFPFHVSECKLYQRVSSIIEFYEILVAGTDADDADDEHDDVGGKSDFRR